MVAGLQWAAAGQQHTSFPFPYLQEILQGGTTKATLSFICKTKNNYIL